MRFETLGRILKITSSEHPSVGWTFLLLSKTPWNEQIALISTWKLRQLLNQQNADLNISPQLDHSYRFIVDVMDIEDLLAGGAIRAAHPLDPLHVDTVVSRIGPDGFVEFRVQVDLGSLNAHRVVSATVVGSALYRQLPERKNGEQHTVWVGLRKQENHIYKDFEVKDDPPEPYVRSPGSASGGTSVCEIEPSLHPFWHARRDGL